MRHPCHQVLTSGQGERETISLSVLVSGRGPVERQEGTTNERGSSEKQKGSKKRFLSIPDATALCA